MGPGAHSGSITPARRGAKGDGPHRGVPMKKVLIAVLAPALLAAPVALAQATEEPSAQPARASRAAEFIEKAGKGGMFEVLSSDLALKRAMDGKVKDFAKRMVPTTSWCPPCTPRSCRRPRPGSTP